MRITLPSCLLLWRLCDYVLCLNDSQPKWCPKLSFVAIFLSNNRVVVGAQLENIARAGRLRVFAAGQQLIHAGERGCSVFIVCSGVVSCRIGDVEVRQFSAGQSFGDMSIFCDHMYRVHEEHESILGDAGALCNLCDPSQRSTHPLATNQKTMPIRTIHSSL